MAQNDHAADDAQTTTLDLDALSEGDRVTVAYDSRQSETPVEKSGEVVKTWNTGYEFVADGDDADERQIKVVRNHGVRGRARVTSKLRPEGGETVLGNEWVHGAELGFVEESHVEGDDEDETTRSDLSETEAEVEEAADASEAVEYPVLDVSPRDDPDGGVLAKDPYEWSVRCSGVDLTALDAGYLTVYHRFEVLSVRTAGSRGPGVVVRLRYCPE